MSDLIPCAACRRHHRVAEAVCPFCGATSDPRAPMKASRTVHKLTRAAVFAGATLLVPACGPSKGPESAKDSGKDAQVEQAAQDAGATESHDQVQEQEKQDTGVRPDPHGPQPPYGAPPSPEDQIV